MKRPVTSDFIELTPVAGTVGDGQRLPPRPGRYTTLRAEGHDYLYIPERQQLFSLRPELAEGLRLAEYDPVSVAEGAALSDLSAGALDLVSSIARDENTSTLSENRFAHTGLRDVVVHVSQRCNLRCVYCYAVQLNKANAIMRPDVADAVVARTMSLAGAGLASVKFLGGEPTLAWPIIERLMSRYLAASDEASIPRPRFTMVTNGTKMTPAMIAVAAERRMYVLVSVDGPPEIHDLLRPDAGGGSTYHKAIETCRALVDAGVDTAIEAVYTRQHFVSGISPQDLIKHYLSLGIREFQIAPAVGIWHESDTIDEMGRVAELFAEAARRSVRSFRSETPYLLRGIQFVLDGFALRERRRHVCGAGRTFMGINYDGEAFPCYLLESAETSYGFVDDRWNEDRYQALKQRFIENGKEYHPVCRECWANEICQSCLGTSWQIAPNVTKPPSWFCMFQKRIIAAVLSEIAAVRESDDWARFLSNMKAYLRPLGDSA